MHNYANQRTIKLQLSSRDAVLQYERRLRKRGWARFSASPVFKIIPFTFLQAADLWTGIVCQLRDLNSVLRQRCRPNVRE